MYNFSHKSSLKPTHKNPSAFISNQQLLEGLRQKSLKKNKGSKTRGTDISMINNRHKSELNDNTGKCLKSKKDSNEDLLRRNMNSVSVLETVNCPSLTNRKHHGSVNSLRSQQEDEIFSKVENTPESRTSHKGVSTNPHCLKIPNDIMQVILQLCDHTSNKQIVTRAHHIIHKYTSPEYQRNIIHPNQSSTSTLHRGMSERLSLQAVQTNHQFALLNKIEQLYKQKNNMKKQNKLLHQKVKRLSQQLANSYKQFEKENKPQGNGCSLGSSNLHQLVIQQSQVISRQALEYQQETQALKRVLYSQARCLQSKMR